MCCHPELKSAKALSITENTQSILAKKSYLEKVGVLERENCVADIPPMVADSMLLVPGERVDRAWKATYSPPAQNGRLQSNFKGFLVLTNHRLFFVAERGVLSIRFSVALTIDYEDIAGIERGATSIRSWYHTGAPSPR